MRVSHPNSRFLVLLMEQYCRYGSTHSEGNSKVDPFKILPNREYCYLFSSRNRHCDWSFAFPHASTSSKCILFAIRCLSHLSPCFEPWDLDWIVSEMVDWLKVCDPALIKEISWNPDNWEEPNSRSSTTGSTDRVG